MNKIARVTDEEQSLLLAICERNNSLQELLGIVNKEMEPNLFENITNDIIINNNAYSSWWKDMREKYGWDDSLKGLLKFDFKTGNIYIDELSHVEI